MEKTQIRTLRIHHLLCIPLFAGEGYNDSFCANMTGVIRLLRKECDAPLTAVCAPDMICAGCPNLREDGSCGNSANNQVVQKDARLAEALQIKAGETYTFRTLLELAQKNLTKEMFENSCANCEWYRKGLCSYEKWITQMGETGN